MNDPKGFWSIVCKSLIVCPENSRKDFQLDLLVQSQQWKHQNNVLNLLKVNHKYTRITSITSFWCLYGYFEIISDIFCILIVDFEHVNAGWVVTFPLLQIYLLSGKKESV